MGKNRRSHRQPQRQSAAMLETSAGPFESLSPRIPTSPKQHLYYLQPVISPRYILIQNVTVQNPLVYFNPFPHHHLSKNPPRNLYHPTPPATRRATLASSPPTAPSFAIHRINPPPRAPNHAKARHSLPIHAIPQNSRTNPPAPSSSFAILRFRSSYPVKVINIWTTSRKHKPIPRYATDPHPEATCHSVPSQRSH